MKKQVVARAPGKLIISGEYSVLLGMPAISFAIDDFTEVTASLTDEGCVAIELNDYGLKARLSWDEVHSNYVSIQSLYNDFLSGLLPIEKVLESPMDLCCFILFSSLRAKLGLKISINSSIPISSGFGSSAAFIVGLLKALDSLFCLNLTDESLYKLALEAENLVHGASSGIDIRTAIRGGWNYFNVVGEKASNVVFEFFTIFTGKPEASTGQSIAKVRDKLEISKRLFNEVTLKLKKALEMGDCHEAKEQVKRNHLLLSELGVVPKTVQKFIEEIERASGAAKICGSGAVLGENAGAVIALGEFNAINEIAKKYGYKVKKVNPSKRGAYVLQD